MKQIDVDPDNPSYCSQDGVLFDKAMVTLVQFPAGREGSYTVPEGVKKIDEEAFHYSRLTSVSFPTSLSVIGESAFSFSKLTSVTISEGVETIEDEAFCKCGELTEVILSSTVKSLGQSAFEQCTELNSVTIPDGLASIGQYCFINCDALKKITIPNSVSRIDHCAFGFSYDFPSQSFLRVSGFKVWGITGSAAYTYAMSNGLDFQAIQDNTGADPSTGTNSSQSTVPASEAESNSDPISGESSDFSGLWFYIVIVALLVAAVVVVIVNKVRG